MQLDESILVCNLNFCVLNWSKENYFRFVMNFQFYFDDANKPVTDFDKSGCSLGCLTDFN